MDNNSITQSPENIIDIESTHKTNVTIIEHCLNSSQIDKSTTTK